MTATDKCSQCDAAGLDVSKLEGTPPEGFRALCPGRLDGSEPDRLFCEACAGAEPCQACGRVHLLLSDSPDSCGPLHVTRPRRKPAPLVLDVDAGTVRPETRGEGKARRAREEKVAALTLAQGKRSEVRTGPTDPARAAKYAKVGLEDKAHAVWVTLPGGDEVEIGKGSPKVCGELAAELRESEEAAREAVRVVESMERERAEERGARKGRGK